MSNGVPSTEAHSPFVEADAGNEVVPLWDAAGKIDIVVDDDDVRREQGDEPGQRDEVGREPARKPLGRDVYSGAGRAVVSGREREGFPFPSCGSSRARASDRLLETGYMYI